MRFKAVELRHSLEIGISTEKEVEKKFGESPKWPNGWIEDGDDCPCCAEPIPSSP
jgi:hypothetical protein